MRESVAEANDIFVDAYHEGYRIPLASRRLLSLDHAIESKCLFLQTAFL